MAKGERRGVVLLRVTRPWICFDLMHTFVLQGSNLGIDSEDDSTVRCATRAYHDDHFLSALVYHSISQ